MPLPDCSARPSDCHDLAIVNTMDGFNLLPRISVPFDGDIDPDSVSSSSIFIAKLAQTEEETAVANTVGINQAVWDPETLTLHVESDEVLRQTTRYAVIVTNGIRDISGRPVQASDDFNNFWHDLNYGQTKSEELKEYRKALLSTLAAIERLGVSRQDVVAASVFTTETATATLENIRDYLKSSPPPAQVNFAIGPGGARAVFAVSSISSITLQQHTAVNPDGFTNATVPLAILNAFGTGTVSTVAYGTFVSPQFIGSSAMMSARGTLELPALVEEKALEFVLFLPSGQKPASGWPVVFLGHGGTTNIHTAAVWNFVSNLAVNGFASIGINAVGRGFGPKSALRIEFKEGTVIQIDAGGRGFDQDGIQGIGNQEGATALAPFAVILGQRDAVRQTAVDYMQLVRVIEAGVDADGDGTLDLDASRMAFLGNSFAVGYEVLFMAVEPSVLIGAVGSPGGLPGRADLLSMRPSARTMVGAQLGARIPSLLNSAYGLTSLGGLPAAPPFYNENIPLRDLPPLTNNIPGAMAIQELFEHIEWVQQSSDAAAYAPHLYFEPLAGVPAKSMVVLFAKGDQTAPNPRTSLIVRAGLLREKTIFYRNDLAFAEDMTVPKDPHTFLQPIASAGTTAGQVARGGQQTIGIFLASSGTVITLPDITPPEPGRFYEFPVQVLPEDYSYIP